MTQRLQSLDAFRGISIAAMILVNNPGTWEHVYTPLRHAAWNGCTPTDLIFPFFLFIIGVAVTFSFDRQRESGASRRHLYANIARRTVLIFGLGIFLNGFPLFDWSVLRIPGVLQRIALCYGCVALLVLNTGVRGQSLTAGLLLASYWLAMAWVRVPGRVSGGFDVEGNLAAYVDTLVLRGHLLHAGWDPEGLLSTLPAIATTLAGALAGQWIRRAPRASLRVAGLAMAGIIGVGVGLLLDRWCPINKNLWTSSYVLFTAGMACVGLAACYWLIDVRGHRHWSTPFIIYGTNPIVACVLSSLIAKEMLLWRATQSDGSAINLQRHLFESIFLPLARPVTASLLYALAYVLVWLGVTALLYRKRVLIKI